MYSKECCLCKKVTKGWVEKLQDQNYNAYGWKYHKSSININKNNCESNVENFDAVIAYINIKVLDENQAVSMSTLNSL